MTTQLTIPRPLDRRPVPAEFRTYAACRCGWVRALYGHRRPGKHIGPMGKARNRMTHEPLEADLRAGITMPTRHTNPAPKTPPATTRAAAIGIQQSGTRPELGGAA